MVLSDKSLKELLSRNELVITPYSEGQLGPTSIDLHLGHSIVKYTCASRREIELLNWYRKLTPEKQDAIRQMAKLLAE